MGDLQKPEAQAVADLALKLSPVEVVGVDELGFEGAAKVLSVPDGRKVISVKPFLDEYLTAPRRREGTAKFSELDSFIGHANRFKDLGSALFADVTGRAAVLVSVLDYHEGGPEGSPRFGKHRGHYPFPVSDEWKAWTGSNGAAKAMSQEAFAEFIENRIVDIADPSTAGVGVSAMADGIGGTFAMPAKLLELSRGLQVNVGAAVKNAVNLGTGEAQINYVTTHADATGAALKVPTAFLIAIPVFVGGAPYQLAARLRYRVREGGITWFYELFRADAAFDHAVKEACTKAATDTGLPLFFGTPE